VSIHPDAYWERYPVAKKEHRCCECDKTIRAGNKYRNVSGIWEEEFTTYKQCLRCASVMKALEYEASDDEDYPYFGEVRECLQIRTQERAIFRKEVTE